LYYGNMVHGKLEGPVNVHTNGRTAHSYFVDGGRVTNWARGPAPSKMAVPEEVIVEKRKVQAEKEAAAAKRTAAAAEAEKKRKAEAETKAEDRGQKSEVSKAEKPAPEAVEKEATENAQRPTFNVQSRSPLNPLHLRPQWPRNRGKHRQLLVRLGRSMNQRRFQQNRRLPTTSPNPLNFRPPNRPQLHPL